MGDILLLGGSISGIFACCAWGMAHLGHKSLGRKALQAYYLHVILITMASLWLYYLIFTHRFEYAYVYSHTSTTLSPLYLLSSFWAGQAGSFLFWVLCGAWIGIALTRHGQSAHLFFYSLIQFCLTLVLLLRSPFELSIVIPTEGSGLNPLLINPWMAIHPPIVFLGYAGLAVPYALALGSSVLKKEKDWVKLALPWTLFGWLTLGAGIFIGAYWAYEVLGWGGYWTWDPVENASLVPWLTGSALVHGLLMQKKRGQMVKLNLVLAVVTYILVIYATFITRSGLLADFSVHAFADQGLNTLLLTILLLFFAAAIWVFYSRWSRLKEDKTNWDKQISSFSWTIHLLLFSAFLVILGTSAPMLTGIFGQPASVEQSFYNMTNFPIAIVVGVLMGICPLGYKQGLSPSNMVLTLTSILLAYRYGMANVFHLLFLAVFVFALLVNMGYWLKSMRTGIIFSGGYLVHMGIALLFIGVLFTANYSSLERLTLIPGKTEEIFGYGFVFQGDGPTGEMEIQVSRNQSKFLALPKIYQTPDNRLMREPHIRRGFFSDMYISPLDLRQDKGRHLIVTQGEERNIDGYQLIFRGFEMGDHDTQEMRVGAKLYINDQDREHFIIPTLSMGSQTRQQQIAYVEEIDLAIALEELDPASRQVLLRLFNPKTGPRQLIVDVSTKPLVSFLWIGTILIMVGTLLALVRRIDN